MRSYSAAVIQWQPGYVYPPVFHPAHIPIDAVSTLIFALVAAGAFFVTLRRPANGVAALIICTPFSFAHYFHDTSVTIVKVALVGFVVAMIVGRCNVRAIRDPRSARLLIAIAVIVVTMMLSAFGAEHKDAVTREIAKWLEYGAIFTAAVVGFSNDPDDRPIWIAISAITATVSLLGIAQEFIGAPAGVFVHGRSIPRIAGPLEGPNQFSAWLGIVIPILLARILIHRDGLLVAITVVAAVADALTLSRSGIIAAIIGCVVVIVATRPPRAVHKRFAAGALVVATILVVLGASIGLEARFFSVAEVPQPDHLGTRAELWKAALDLWRTAPLLGIGAGNYELELGRVGFPQVHTHANSIYLQSLAETGLVGLAAMLFLVYTSIQTFAQKNVRRPLVIGALAASIVLTLHQIFDYLVFFPKIGSLWFLILAIGTVELMSAQNEYRDVEIST